MGFRKLSKAEQNLPENRTVWVGVLIGVLFVFFQAQAQGDEAFPIVPEAYFGWEVELLPKVAAKLTKYYNFNSPEIRQKLIKQITNEDLNQALELRPELLEQLPKSVQQELTKGLNLSVSLIGSSQVNRRDSVSPVEAPGLLTSPVEPTRTSQSPSEEPFSADNFRTNEGGILVSAAGEWAKVHMRWSKISRKTRLQWLNMNHLPEKIKSHYWHKLSLNPPVLDEIPTRVATLLQSLDTTLDEGAIEFRHRAPKRGLEDTYKELKLFVQLAGVERMALQGAGLRSGATWGSIHLHGSRREPFRKEMVYLYRFDLLLNDLEMGIINDLQEKDEINKYSQSLTSRSGLRMLGFYHVERRNFPRTVKEEFIDFGNFFLTKDKTTYAALEEKIRLRLLRNHRYLIHLVFIEDPDLLEKASIDVLLQMAERVPESRRPIEQAIFQTMEPLKDKDISYRFLQGVQEILSKFPKRRARRILNKMKKISPIAKEKLAQLDYYQAPSKHNYKKIAQGLESDSELIAEIAFRNLVIGGNPDGIEYAKVYFKANEARQLYLLSEFWDYTDLPQTEWFFQKGLSSVLKSNASAAIYGYIRANGRFDLKPLKSYWENYPAYDAVYKNPEKASPLRYLIDTIALYGGREAFDIIIEIKNQYGHYEGIQDSFNYAISRTPLIYSRKYLKQLMRADHQRGRLIWAFNLPPNTDPYLLMKMAPKGGLAINANADKQVYPEYIRKIIRIWKRGVYFEQKGVLSKFVEMPTEIGVDFLLEELHRPKNLLWMPVIGALARIVEDKNDPEDFLKRSLSKPQNQTHQFPTEIQSHISDLRYKLNLKTRGTSLSCAEAL